MCLSRIEQDVGKYQQSLLQGDKEIKSKLQN